MTILKQFEPWPQIQNPNRALDIWDGPSTIDEGLVTLVNNGMNRFVRDSGRRPTHLILGPNAALKFKQLPPEYNMQMMPDSVYKNELMGLQIIYSLDNGIWLF